MTAQQFASKYFDSGKTTEPFRDDVTVDWIGDPNTAPGVATSNKINPVYCATPECAHDLALILGRPVKAITLAPPFPGWPQANQFTQSAQVPYLTIMGFNSYNAFVAVTQNAGQMASFFTHGFAPDAALQLLQHSVDMDLLSAMPENS